MTTETPRFVLSSPHSPPQSVPPSATPWQCRHCNQPHWPISVVPVSSASRQHQCSSNAFVQADRTQRGDDTHALCYQVGHARSTYPISDTDTRTSKYASNLTNDCCWLNNILAVICNYKVLPTASKLVAPPKTPEFMLSQYTITRFLPPRAPKLATEVKHYTTCNPCPHQLCTPRPTAHFQHLLGATVLTTSPMARGALQVEVYNVQRTVHDAHLTGTKSHTRHSSCAHPNVYEEHLMTQTDTLQLTRSPSKCRSCNPGLSNNNLERQDAPGRRRTTYVSGLSRGPQRRDLRLQLTIG